MISLNLSLIENSFHEVSERRRSSLGEDPGPETSNQEEKGKFKLCINSFMPKAVKKAL